jgi:hypothetical protein
MVACIPRSICRVQGVHCGRYLPIIRRRCNRCGDEAAWRKESGTNPIAVARALWLKSHPLRSSLATPQSARVEIGLRFCNRKPKLAGLLIN